MKYLKDGGKAFYTSGLVRTLLVGAFVLLTGLLGLMIWYSFSDSASIKAWATPYLLFGGMWGLSLLGIFRLKKPICIIYLDKICVQNQEIAWKEVQFYHLDRWNRYTPFFVAGIKEGRGVRLDIAFHSLGREDQLLLEQELTCRGVPTQKAYLEKIGATIKNLSQELDQLSK